MSARDVVLVGVVVFALGLGFLILNFAMTTMTSSIITQPSVNSSSAAITAFGSVTTTVNRLDYILFCIFIGFSLALIITGWFIGSNPIFVIFYFIANLVFVAISALLANVWETIATSTTFLTTAGHFPITNQILTHLPIYMAVVGFIGIVVMFAKPYISGEA
jgi:hypothetical protein